MNLARALRALSGDRRLTALGALNNPFPTYVYLARTDGHVQVHMPGLVRPLVTPFDIGALDDSQRTLVARLALEVDWTLFRGGLPLEEAEAVGAKGRGKRVVRKRV